MPETLSLADAARVNNDLTLQLEGFTNVPMPGTSSKNSEHAAWQLLLSQRMSAYAEAFKKKAMAEAVKAGVLFDHSKSPRAAGVDEDVYAGDFVRVNLKTKKGSSRVDMKKLESILRTEYNVSDIMWSSIIGNCTTENAAPHTFTASLRT